MALAVWIIYAADRLLDARRAEEGGAWAGLEARHRFHFAHRRAFAAGIGVAVAALGALLPALDAAALRLYLIEGGLLFAWFLALHTTHSAHRLPKEIAVGIFFSAAVFIPTVARVPALRVELAPAALLLAGLGALNCLFIYAWEHIRGPCTQTCDLDSSKPPHATTRLALERLSPLAVTTLVAGLALAVVVRDFARLISAACALSTALLLALDRNRGRLSRIHLRVFADLALLTPLLIVPLLPLLSR